MQTVYDWVSVGIFGGLIILFLQRSTSDAPRHGDSLLLYLAAGVGCAVANYLGNAGHHVIAIGLIGLTVGFIFHYLKPFSSSSD